MNQQQEFDNSAKYIKTLGAKFLSINNQTSASKAIHQLGWRPQIRQTLLSDIKYSTYRTLSALTSVIQLG